MSGTTPIDQGRPADTAGGDAHVGHETFGRGRVRWGIAALLGGGLFVNYIDRVNLSVAGSAILDDLHISATQLGNQPDQSQRHGFWSSLQT